jgi:hypothetical protein
VNSKGLKIIEGNGCCLWGIQHWRELLSQSEVILELLSDTVTLAGGSFEFPAVHNLHCASYVIYDSLLLQDCCRQAHRGSVGTHHGRNEIMGDRKYSQIDPILSHQQPPREALLYIVESIARCGLCDLHPLKPGMPAQGHLQLRSRPQNAFQRIPHHSKAIAGDLDDFAD